MPTDIDRLTTLIGRAAAWLCLFIVVAQFVVVLMRYGFGIGSAKLTESIFYAHAALFMLAAAWTLRVDGHVRVDIFYADAPPRRKAMVDLLGALLLLIPFALSLLILSLPYVARSWTILERSRETSGLPFVYLLKTLIPVFALSLVLQGVSQAIRAAHTLRAAHVMTLPEIFADLHWSRRLPHADGGLSGRVHAWRRVARLRVARTSLRRV